MSDLGTIISKKAGSLEAIQNNDAFALTNSRLLDFLARTSSIGKTSQSAADIIDPLQTFDVEFKFYPNLNDNKNFNEAEIQNIRNDNNNRLAQYEKNRNELNKLQQFLKNNDISKMSAKNQQSLKNKLTNLLKQQQQLQNIVDIAATNASNFSSDSSNQSFLYNLANQIYEKSPENGYSNQLILQMGYYIQSMTIPQMTMPEAGKVPTLFGEFPVNNLYVKTDNNTFTMSILNTKVSIHDYIFYPWMREVTLPVWSYNKQPYTTATVTVMFDKHSNLRYVFCGCRPSQIASRQPTQAPEGEPTRDITMLFDYMFITDAESSSAGFTYNAKVLQNATDFYQNYNNLKNKLVKI